MKHIVVSLLFAGLMAAAPPTSLEWRALEGDWPKLKTMINSDPSLARSPERAMLFAHALLADNDLNNALCGFASISSVADRAAWERWTAVLVGKTPKSAAAHYLHGDALARMRQFDAAIAEFSRALAIEPNSYMALNARGIAHAINGRLDDALLDFWAASTANPAFADAQMNRGYLYVQRLGSAASQMKAFEAALSLSPASLLAAAGRGRALVASGRGIAGIQSIDESPHSCKALEDIAASDHRVLFEWVRTQGEVLLAGTGRPANAGSTLDTALRQIETKRDVASVKAAIDVASKSGDPKQQQKLTFTLQSMERTDKQIAPVIGKALNEEKVASGAQRGNLLKESSVKVQRDGEVALQFKNGGLNVGGKVSASNTGDLEKYAAAQTKALDQKDSFLSDLNSKLTSGVKETGGAETSHIAMARIDRGDAPRPWHNTLLYSATGPKEGDRK